MFAEWAIGWREKSGRKVKKMGKLESKSGVGEKRNWSGKIEGRQI